MRTHSPLEPELQALQVALWPHLGEVPLKTLVEQSRITNNDLDLRSADAVNVATKLVRLHVAIMVEGGSLRSAYTGDTLQSEAETDEKKDNQTDDDQKSCRPEPVPPTASTIERLLQQGQQCESKLGCPQEHVETRARDQTPVKPKILAKSRETTHTAEKQHNSPKADMCTRTGDSEKPRSPSFPPLANLSPKVGSINPDAQSMALQSPSSFRSNISPLSVSDQMLGEVSQTICSSFNSKHSSPSSPPVLPSPPARRTSSTSRFNTNVSTAVSTECGGNNEHASSPPPSHRLRANVGVGLAFAQRPKGGFYISEMAKNGVADRCGMLRCGDVLVAIDDTLLDRQKHINPAQMLLGWEGTSLKLTVCRSPSTGTFQVTLCRAVPPAEDFSPNKVCVGMRGGHVRNPQGPH